LNGVIQVCEGCTDADPAKRAARTGGGPALRAAVDALVADLPADAGMKVAGFSCIGNCAKRVRLSVAGPGRWSWLFGELSPADAPALKAFVSVWLAAPAGLVPKNDRPPTLRPKILGRVPPAGVG